MSNENINIPVYEEPKDIDYIIIKVKESCINGDRGGSLYEATRRAWHARLESAMPYKYVLSVVGGVVKEVWHVTRWYVSTTEAPRIEFEGEQADYSIREQFLSKMIPECYRQKGLASPFLYNKKPEAAATPVVEHKQIDLETLIKAAMTDGMVTDKERQFLVKKGVEAGYDPEEFELILDAQIYEMMNKK